MSSKLLINGPLEQLAVVGANSSLTYAELEIAIADFQERLLDAGAQPGNCVVVNIRRSVDYVLVMLATLDLGIVFVPADPSWPEAYIESLATSVDALLVVSEAGLLNRNGNARLYQSDIHYILPTSGSTGAPKFVLGSLNPIIHFLNWYLELYGDHERRYALSSGLCYDPIFRDVLAPLKSGGTLFIPSQEELLSTGFSEWLNLHQISALHTTPTLLGLLTESTAGHQLPALTYVFSGGELLRAGLVRDVYRILPHIQLVNFYGLTETPQAITHYKVPRNIDADFIPIGKAAPGTRISIAGGNESGEGELIIHSHQLLLGYLDSQGKIDLHEELTFATGDIGFINTEGDAVLTGRKDRVVKINGARVDLQGIEATISRFPEVAGCRVELVESLQGDSLVGFYNSSVNGDSELQSFLRANLPGAHVPSKIIKIDEFPLTGNGKIDARKLRLLLKDNESTVNELSEVVNSLEGSLLEILRKQLGNEGLGVNDNFFSLGGNSLAAIRFVNEVQSKLGLIVYVLSLYESPTMRLFANKLAELHPGRITEQFDVLVQDTNAGSQWIENKLELFNSFIKQYPDLSTWSGKKIPAVFILGAPRSGTTLLRVILNGHSSLFSPPALYLLQFSTASERSRIYSGAHAFWKEGVVTALTEALEADESDIEDWLQRLENDDGHVMEVYQKLSLAASPRLLVDKTANYAIDIRILKSMEQWFDAKYIYLARHPGASIQSFLSADLTTLFYSRIPELREKGAQSFTKRELSELVWTRSHENIQEFLSEVDSERQYSTSYEQLVNSPEETVSEICKFLQISYQPSMLEIYDDSEKRMTGGKGGSIMTGDPKFHQHEKISTVSVNAWRKHIQENTISDYTWRVAKQVGYSRQDSNSASGALLLNPPITQNVPNVFGFYSLTNYKQLAKLLALDSNFYVVHVASESAEVKGEEEVAKSIGQLSDDYISIIKQQQPSGPYRFVGFSFAGLIAIEVANKLRDQGDDIEWVCLLDPRILVGNSILRKIIHGLGLGVKLKAISSGRALRKKLKQRMTRETFHEVVIFVQSSHKKRYQKLRQKNSWRKLLKGQLHWHVVEGSHLGMIKEPFVNAIADLLRPHLTSGTKNKEGELGQD